ncbi:hypothetical protein FOCC_FOCC017196 [Frankliniella occidentalis]|nr:hypothetical protein FOCC_FOCC017196 [Frankliniella occidentalis]
MDGKHCRIDPPLKSGSMFYNYKETFSIVLFALLDADYRFIFVDVEANGQASDRGIWNRCFLKGYIESDRSKVPNHSQLRVQQHFRMCWSVIKDSHHRRNG